MEPQNHGAGTTSGTRRTYETIITNAKAGMECLVSTYQVAYSVKNLGSVNAYVIFFLKCRFHSLSHCLLDIQTVEDKDRIKKVTMHWIQLVLSLNFMHLATHSRL